ncbi:hypothetical protein CTA1_3196 [Colletotrichum tanaceti]|uniref:Uncharacterized protein n=1 Tax=Colletotrichum tanaceti TaxID=1306861 RepID=A0A4U6XSA4_9PEZI|nr:hypothetical protein CTA1_3196 [Colletotrichum tanaceti]
MESQAEMVDGFVVVGNAKMAVDTDTLAAANSTTYKKEDFIHGIHKIMFQKLGLMRGLNEQVTRQNATMMKQNKKLLEKNAKVIKAIERLLNSDIGDQDLELNRVNDDMEDTAFSCAALDVVMEHLNWEPDVYQDYFRNYIIEKGIDLNSIVPYTYDCEEGASRFREHVLYKGFKPEQTVAEWKASFLFRSLSQLNTRHCARVYMTLVYQALGNYAWSNNNHQDNGSDNGQGIIQDYAQGDDDQDNGLDNSQGNVQVDVPDDDDQGDDDQGGGLDNGLDYVSQGYCARCGCYHSKAW